MYGLLALFAGAAIGLQAAMNSRLGVLLKSSMMGTSVAFFMSLLFSLTVLLMTASQLPKSL